MAHGTSNSAIITSASPQWVLLSVVYHHVLARSPSPEAAKISISEAWEKGQLRLRAELREHEARPGVILRPGEPIPEIEPKCKRDQPIPASQKLFESWDWERSYANWIDRTTKSFFEYVNIEGNRDDVLKLWPTAQGTGRATTADSNTAKPADVTPLVWAVVLALDAMEKERSTGLWGITQKQLTKMVSTRLAVEIRLRTLQKAVAFRRKRDVRR